MKHYVRHQSYNSNKKWFDIKFLTHTCVYEDMSNLHHTEFHALKRCGFRHIIRKQFVFYFISWNMVDWRIIHIASFCLTRDSAKMQFFGKQISIISRLRVAAQHCFFVVTAKIFTDLYSSTKFSTYLSSQWQVHYQNIYLWYEMCCV